MKSRRTARFRRAFEKLPADIQQRTYEAFRLWQRHPNHQSLMFKKVHHTMPVFSVRIGFSCRAVGLKHGDTMAWFWVGAHDDYERLLAQL